MPYQLDNLQLVLFACYLTNVGLSALLVWSGRPFAGGWLWVAGQGLMTVGTLFDFLAPALPPWAVLAVGNTAYAASNVLFLHSVWAFRFPQRFPRMVYAVVAVQFLSFVAVMDQSYAVRTVLFSFWMTVGSLAAGTLLVWKVGKHYQLTHWLTALPFYVLGLASLSRMGVMAWISAPEDSTPAVTANVWYISGAVVLGTIILFGYFAMTRTREEQTLTLKDEEIEARNRKLVESGRAKDLFFSIIAHDLRGPIGGAARYVRKHLLGKMTGIEAKYNEVETLASALEKTNEFLEKLLWWSRAQLQDWVPERVPLDLGRVFEQAKTLVHSAAELKETPVSWDPPPYPRPLADPESVQLILGNLLSNAVKFSLPGRPIHVRVTTQDLLCRITVEDQGVGMDPATLDRLFRIEDKLSTHGTTGERGTGLGLILARSLAERNNGGITIESEPGRGTQASLWLVMQNP